MPVLYKTDIASDADVKVFVTDIRSEADLIAFETTDTWAATEPQIWCYTDIRSDASKAICLVEIAFDADIVVFFTDVQSDACWVNNDKTGLL